MLDAHQPDPPCTAAANRPRGVATDDDRRVPSFRAARPTGRTSAIRGCTGCGSGEIIAQTRDHSKIQSLIQQGLASPAEIDTHPDRNKLFKLPRVHRRLPTVELSRKMMLQPGDTLFLCTDGLWSAVTGAGRSRSGVRRRARSCARCPT